MIFDLNQVWETKFAKKKTWTKKIKQKTKQKNQTKKNIKRVHQCAGVCTGKPTKQTKQSKFTKLENKVQTSFARSTKNIFKKDNQNLYKF